MKSRSVLSGAAFLGFGLTLSIASSTLAQTRQFQGWVAGCDNTRVCTAIAFFEPSKAVAEPGIPFLQIRHHPFRDSAPEIRLFDPGLTGEDGTVSKVGARLVATPTGAEIAKGPELYTPESQGRNGFRFKDGHAWSILHALRSGQAITITIGKKQNLRLVTRGLDAALAYFDDQQELADTPAALVRKPRGELLDYLHPQPPDLETIELAAFGEAEARNPLQYALSPTPRCKPQAPETGTLRYALPGGGSLWRRDCGLEGDNALSAWFIASRADAPATPMNWPSGDDGNRVQGNLLSNAEVFAHDGLIHSVRFHAPTRDCGISERWGLTRDGKFELAERREMPLCRTAGQRHWIVTYRANLVSRN